MLRLGTHHASYGGSIPRLVDIETPVVTSDELIIPGKTGWVCTAEQARSITFDFEDVFSGGVTGISPALPHTINGKQITITPNAVSATAMYSVLAGAESQSIELKVEATPAPLAQTGTVPNWPIEVNRPVYVALWRHVTGGSKPYRFQKVSGPSWAEVVPGFIIVHPQASPTSGTVTARITDRTGQSITLSATINVIATRSRTATHTLQSGQSIASVANGLGSGNVLVVPAALGAVTAGTFSVNVPEGSPPLIIRGEDGAKVNGIVNFTGCSGIIFENFEVIDPGGTLDSASWTVRLGERVWAYDLTLNGAQLSITTPAGSPWKFPDRAYSYPNHGIHLNKSAYAIAHNCTVDRVFKGFDPSGMVYGCEVGRVRDDLFRLEGTSEGLVINCVAETRTLANRKTSEHPDLFQIFAQNDPTPQYVCIQGNFLSAEGEEFQGLLMDHDTWSSTTRDLTEMYTYLYVKNNVFLGGHWLQWYFEWLHNAVYENNLALLHPDKGNAAITFATCRHARPSWARIANNIIGRIDGDAHNGAYGDYRTLIEDVNNLKMDVTGAPSYASIFPNWSDTTKTIRERVQVNQELVDPSIGPTAIRTLPPPSPPVLTGSTPEDGATGVGTTSDIVLVFSENIFAGVGNFTLRNETIGANIEVISAGSAQISGNQVTLDIAPMAGLTQWSLSAPSGVLENSQGDPVAAISISFTTAAASSFTLQPAVSTMTYRGVTINLSTPLPYFWSANGDPVFITENASSITSISPASATDAWNYQHSGAMINPEELRDGGSVGQARAQGYDGAVGNSDFTEKIPYSSTLNKDPARNGAISIAKGSSFSLVKSVRDPAWQPRVWRSIQKLVVFTFMASPPASAGKWLRPPVSTIAKSYPVRAEDMVFSGASSPLRDLPKPSSLSNPSVYLNEINAQGLVTVPIWYGTYNGRKMQLSTETGAATTGYSRDYGRTRALYALSLFIGQSGNATEQAAREQLAIILIQWGIDLDGANQSGNTFGAGAGQWYGYIEFYYITAFMVGSVAMLARAKTHSSNPLNQPFWVTESVLGYPCDWDTGTDGGSGKRCNETYFPHSLGKPEWSQQGTNSEDPEVTDITQLPFAKAKKLNESLGGGYRDTYATCMVVEPLPIALLRNGPNGETGIEVINSIGSGQIASAVLPWIDRSMTLYPVKDNTILIWHSSTALGVYNLWRDEIRYSNGTVVPRWTGKPDIWAGHRNPVFQTGASGAVNWSLADYSEGRTFNMSTLTVTDRQLECSQDNVQFVKRKSLGTATSGNLTGLRPGTPHWFRWRIVNSAGDGPWSQTWFERHPAQDTVANNWLEADRHKLNSGGTVPGGAFVNEVPPALYYMPCPEHPTPRFEPAPANLSSATIYGPNSSGKPKQLIAGIGYWQGGSTTPVITYDPEYEVVTVSGWTVLWQWQRNGANISGATGQRYTPQAADVGQSVRCQLTVNGVVINSNAVIA